MSGLRFAAGLPALARALKGVFPVPKTGKDYMNYAIRLGPEALGAGMVAASLPGEDVDAGTRALAGMEELLMSMGLSTVGSLGGRGIAARRMKGQIRKGTFDVPDGQTRRQAYEEGLNMGATLGDAAVLPLQFLAPRPFYNSQLQQFASEQPAKQVVEEQKDQENTDMMIAALLASGALGGTSMMALDTVNPRRAVLDINGY